MLFRRKAKPVDPIPKLLFDSDERYIASDVAREMADSEELSRYIWSAITAHLCGNWGLVSATNQMTERLQNHLQVESLFEIPCHLTTGTLTGIRIVTDSRRCCTSVWSYSRIRAAS